MESSDAAGRSQARSILVVVYKPFAVSTPGSSAASAILKLTQQETHGMLKPWTQVVCLPYN